MYKRKGANSTNRRSRAVETVAVTKAVERAERVGVVVEVAVAVAR